MDIYADYLSWKVENYDLLKSLVKEKSVIISRFSHVIGVVEYLYNKKSKMPSDLPRDEEVIFETGFNYIFDHFNSITIIIESIFNKNYKELNECAKTINLLLYINDFQQDLLNQASENIDFKGLDELEDQVLELLEAKKVVADTMFALLDDITSNIFSSNNIEYYGINDIMYDIALEYNLINEDDEPMSFFNAYLDNKIAYEQTSHEEDCQCNECNHANH